MNYRSNRRRYKEIKRKARKTAAVFSVIAVIVLVIGFFAIKGLKKNDPAPDPDAPSSSVAKPSYDLTKAPSGLDSSLIKEYVVASHIWLINFDHPNYEDAKDIVNLKDYLDKSVTINSGAGRLNREAASALAELFLAAKADGITTYIVNSAYRTRDQQQGYWDNRIKQNPHYGDDVYTNPVKTVPAYASEHCAGYAVDILCKKVPHGDTEKYAVTEEAKWLKDNAYKYGFILRYPEGKSQYTGIIYEPWHYRYVGVTAAKYIYDSGLSLEEYVAQFNFPVDGQ